MLVDHEGIYLGFDPGGDRKFGVAFLEGNCVRTSAVGSVDEAMKWAVEVCEARQPIAAGIDTLLHWATSKSGMRPCDLQLRNKYPAVRKSIMPPNSLYGAMAIGGMALALRLRQEWPKLALNETHPKVLLYAQGKSYDPNNSETVEAVIQWFVNQGRYTGLIEGEHELDAALSAWATKKGVAETDSERWVDIIGHEDNLLFPAGKVQYLWPESLG